VLGVSRAAPTVQEATPRLRPAGQGPAYDVGGSNVRGVNLAATSVAVHLADTPATWQDPEPMSTLHAILFFVGLPLLIFSLITLLVMAPSLAKGPRYRPSQQWDAEAEWFGARDVEDG